MTYVAACSAALLAALLLGSVVGRTPPRAIGPALADLPRGRWHWPVLQRRRTRSILPAAVAAWADDLARQLRHGSTLRAALADVTPLDPALLIETEPLRHWLERGSSVTDACDEWADDLAGSTTQRSELLSTMAAVLAATSALGGGSAAPLDRLAVTMRHRASDDLERHAQSAQAQLSAHVLTFVPLAVLGLLLATDANVRSIITQPRGASVVALGIGLNTVGAWWMRRIVGATSPGATP